MSQTHHGLLVHAIFSTKYRKNVIAKEWQDDLFAYMGGTAEEHKAAILASGGTENHVHLLIRIHPSYAVADTVRHIKSNASRWVNEKHQPKGNREFRWQRGYGAFSVSQSLAVKVKRYVRNQVEHHRKKTFKEEYLEFLTKHEVEFDEQYAFDEEIVA